MKNDLKKMYQASTAIFFSAALMLSIAGCDGKTPVIAFGETKNIRFYTAQNQSYDMLMGDHMVYVLSGKYSGLKEGQCRDLKTNKVYQFLISQALEQYPALLNPRTQAAATKQMKQLKVKF